MRKKAVVVDDNGNNLILGNDLLEVAGFEVFEAENAAGGIALVVSAINTALATFSTCMRRKGRPLLPGSRRALKHLD